MSRNTNSAPAGDYPIRTERDAGLEQEMEEVRRGKSVRQPSKERLGYEQSQEKPVDERRLNHCGSGY